MSIEDWRRWRWEVAEKAPPGGIREAVAKRRTTHDHAPKSKALLLSRLRYSPLQMKTEMALSPAFKAAFFNWLNENGIPIRQGSFLEAIRRQNWVRCSDERLFLFRDLAIRWKWDLATVPGGSVIVTRRVGDGWEGPAGFFEA